MVTPTSFTTEATDAMTAHCPTTPWYVAQTKPNCCAVAERHLARQGFRVFSPSEERTCRHARKFYTSVRPLFPGYIFVSFDPATVRWRAINGTRGVARLVSFRGDEPAQVPLALIAGMMLRCDSRGRLLPPQLLNAGDLVKVTGGPFAEFIGRVESFAPDRRIWVLLDLMERTARVALPSSMLRLV
jgi:transcriptional antiterminator RfaH